MEQKENLGKPAFPSTQIDTVSKPGASKDSRLPGEKRKYTKTIRLPGDPPRKYTKKAKPLAISENEATVQFDPESISELALEYPDFDYQAPVHASRDSMIAYVDESNILVKLETNICDRAPIASMSLSPDGLMLVTFCLSGSAKVWDTVSFKLIQSLEDASELNINVFYTGVFTPNMRHIIVGGKRKDRKRWSENDNDNHIMPCPLKLFDIVTGKVVLLLEAHQEEILSVQTVSFKGKAFFISTSQDGYIYKWAVSNDYRYFIAACDDKLILFDFDLEQVNNSDQVLQRFDPLFSYFCDCSKFITFLDNPALADEPMYAYLASRGVEVLDQDENTASSHISQDATPNTVLLHKLIYPSKLGEKFVLEAVREFKHDRYLSNSWLVKIACNGRYIAAPTFDGCVYLFDMLTGNVSGILRDHTEIEVRDVIFHPSKKLFFSCADDGKVNVYRQGEFTETGAVAEVMLI